MLKRTVNVSVLCQDSPFDIHPGDSLSKQRNDKSIFQMLSEHLSSSKLYQYLSGIACIILCRIKLFIMAKLVLCVLWIRYLPDRFIV